MEELDLLKRDWNKGNSFEQVSEKDIYRMSHKKSSSIVKWLLAISIIEFAFWMLLTILLNDEKYEVKLQHYGLDQMMFWVNTINYAVLVSFIFFFYRNYRTISTTDSTHQLMKNILKTRKTVQYYIWYNLSIVFINVILTMVVTLYHNSAISSMLLQATNEGHRTFFLFKYTCMWILIVVLIIVLFWLFYKLLYGILLKKLFANYKELKKIDL